MWGGGILGLKYWTYDYYGVKLGLHFLISLFFLVGGLTCVCNKGTPSSIFLPSLFRPASSHALPFLILWILFELWQRSFMVFCNCENISNHFSYDDGEMQLKQCLENTRHVTAHRKTTEKHCFPCLGLQGRFKIVVYGYFVYVFCCTVYYEQWTLYKSYEYDS